MPLLDHFAYPLKQSRPWTGFYSSWANKSADVVNATLPDCYFSYPNVPWVQEGDAVVIEEADPDPVVGEPWTRDWPASEDGNVLVAEAVEPKRVLTFEPDTDTVEVRVVDERGGTQTLVGVVEIVSPTNKAAARDRDKFLTKVEGYLATGVGVVIADIVTNPSKSLHAELMTRLAESSPEADATYASAYRPDVWGSRLAVWHEPLTVGSPLPSLPLCLKDGPVVSVPMESAYAEACRRCRINPEADRAAVAERVGEQGTSVP